MDASDHTGSDEAGPVEVFTPQEMLRQFGEVNIAAPMVRYSKLPFRQLVAQYETHITYTPMLLAKEFSRSSIARDSDFSTNSLERGVFPMTPKIHHVSILEPEPSFELREDEAQLERRIKGKRRLRGNLMAQFAANDGAVLADAAELIKPWVDGIDLNCGCPQRWAFQEGIGCALLRKPDTIRDLVRSTKQRLGWDFPVTVKIRVDQDLSLTNELVTTAIAAGADVLTIHGRTWHQSSSGHPVNLDAIKFAVECSKDLVPCVANGDVFDLDDARETRRRCGVSGVMAARGLLANPALFAGYDKTPIPAISEFIRISTRVGLIYSLFHRHVSYMIESHMTRKNDRIFVNSLNSYAAVCDYLEDEMGLDLRSSL